MQPTETAEESKVQEARQTQVEREQILEFEKHLAAASTKATITESTSLLLPQLITMDPLGPARKPPPSVSIVYTNFHYDQWDLWVSLLFKNSV